MSKLDMVHFANMQLLPMAVVWWTVTVDCGRSCQLTLYETLVVLTTCILNQQGETIQVNNLRRNFALRSYQCWC